MRKFNTFERRKRIYAACISTLLFLMAQGGAALSADYWLPVEGTDCKVWNDEPPAKGEVIKSATRRPIISSSKWRWSAGDSKKNG